MKVQEIITNAIYKSLQDRSFESTINRGDILFGLYELNNLLDEWRDKIPYRSSVTYNNVENLENSRFVEISTVNYVINNNSYSLLPVNIVRFKEIQDVIGLNGFPSVYFFDELTQTIEVYPKPSDTPYKFTVWGKISLLNLGESDDVPINMPLFMVKAFTYELAFLMAAEYGRDWDSKKEAIRVSSAESLMRKKSIDLSPPVDCIFGNSGCSDGEGSFPYFYYLSGGR